MGLSSSLQVIKFSPAFIVVTCNCIHDNTTIASNNESASIGCHRCIIVNAEIELRIDNLDRIKSDYKEWNQLFVIRIFCNFSPFIAGIIIRLSFVGIIAISACSEWNAFNVCQGCVIMSIRWICMIVINRSIVAEKLNKYCYFTCIRNYLSHILLWSYEKHKSILSSGRE